MSVRNIFDICITQIFPASGNEVLHELTTGRSQILRVDLGDWDGAKRHAEYQVFLVEDEGSEFRLHLGQYTGDAGNGLLPHDNMLFSTTDRDNDKSGVYSYSYLE